MVISVPPERDAATPGADATTARRHHGGPASVAAVAESAAPTRASATRPPALLAGLLAHLRAPLYRNAYALVLNTVATSGLGVLYWVVAAHTYTTDAVGLNASAISAMIFLSGLAQLNLTSFLVRFVPAAGAWTARLVGYSYLTSILVSLVVVSVFLLGLGIWTPALGFLRASPLLAGWFVLATVTWSIFTLQDSVLTGLGQAVWVPVENTLFGAVKLILLLLLATVFPSTGIFASWTIPVVLSLLPVNLLLFGRLLPRHHQTVTAATVPRDLRNILGFVGGDYIGALLLLASTTLMPVLVTHLAGASANAYFFQSWIIANSLQLMTINLATSLTVEVARDQTKLTLYTRRIARQVLRLLVPAVAIIVLGAPYILRVFGQNYAAAGTGLLRLLALATLPGSVVVLTVAVARVRRRMREVVLIQGASAALIFGLSAFFLARYGILGIGLAVLLAQTALAGIVFVTRLWPVLRIPRAPGPPARLAGNAAPSVPGASEGAVVDDEAFSAASRPARLLPLPELHERDVATPPARRRAPRVTLPRPVCWTNVISPLLAIAALALFFTSLGAIDIRRIDDLGLISVLPPAVYGALLLLTVGFCLTLYRSRSELLLWSYCVALVVMLFGITSFIEPVPRFAATWKHIGIIEYIMRYGSVDPSIDAYFNWPGFFIFGAFFNDLAGFKSALDYAAWAPVLFNLLYLAPLVLLLDALSRDRRLVWLGVWLFYLTNWVGQDYFSPQGLDFFLGLVILAVLVRWFRPADAGGVQATRNGAGRVPAWLTKTFYRLAGWLTEEEAAPRSTRAAWQAGGMALVILLAWLGIWLAYLANWIVVNELVLQWLNYLLGVIALAVVVRWFGPAVTNRPVVPRSLAGRATSHPLGALVLRIHDSLAADAASPVPVYPGQRAGLLVLVVLVFAAIVPSHQLTPFVILASVATLVILERCTARSLPILLAVILGSWLSYAAVTFLRGHTDMVTGQIGQLGATVSMNVTARLAGSPGHQTVVYLRLLMTVAVWVLAGFGILRGLARGMVSLIALALAAVPFPLMILQPYGGEMILRVYLFALPFMIFFAALLFFPRPDAGRRWWTAVAIGLLSVVLMGTFFVTRYGNERMDYYTADEFQAVQALYAVAPPGAVLAAATSDVPWRYRDYAAYDYMTLAERGPLPDATAAVQLLTKRPAPAAYLILSRAQRAYAELFMGLSPAEWARFEASVRASPNFKLIYANQDAAVYVLVNGQLSERHGPAQ